jgi:hypothetical protein
MCSDDILPIKLFLNLLGNSILVASIVYSLMILLSYVRTAADSSKKRVIRSFFVLTLAFLPYMVLDMKIERMPYISRHFPYGIFSVPLFLLVSSVLALYYGYNEFKVLFLADKSMDKVTTSEELKKSKNEDKEDFYITYNIIKR